ncbi:DUF4138 domain-containing protein [Pedobacter sp. MW01-1-1]|uniref:DUF4138 domain-containing protein n=1 Tax=Pedobacter sp. MW01-1-1 TaxID=3383027 RepID=UPI003FED88E4
MKNIILSALLVIIAGALFAQSSGNIFGGSVEIPKIFIKRSLNLHFLAPEKIKYVDIPNGLVGDLPDENLLRIKIPDSVKIKDPFLGVLTILGEKRIKQYTLVYDERSDTAFSSLITIPLSDMNLVQQKSSVISSREIDSISNEMVKNYPLTSVTKERKNGIRASLNGILSVGEFLLVDIGFQNTSNIPYQIDGLRFRIEDQKQHKATTVQSLEVVPISSLRDIKTFDKSYRNVFVLRRLTFPDHKLLKVELSEKQLSGRSIDFGIRYSDILKAKKINQ